MIPTLLLTASLLLGASWFVEGVPFPENPPGRSTAFARDSLGRKWLAHDRAPGGLVLGCHESGWRVETAVPGPLEAFALAVTSRDVPLATSGGTSAGRAGSGGPNHSGPG